MQLPTSVFIGLRYTRARRRNQFISFVSGFSLLGMLLGTAALIIVMSVMNGFDREIKGRLLQVIPHLEFIGTDQGLENSQQLQQQLAASVNVVTTAPYVTASAMVNFRGGLQGVELRGMSADDISKVTDVEEHIFMGGINALKPGDYGIVLGGILARNLGATVGDQITLVLPQLTVTPVGIFPRMKRLTVVGIFEIGGQPDQYLGFVDLQDAQALLRLGDRVSGVEVRTTDMYRSEEFGAQLWNSLPESARAHLRMQDWTETQSSLFSAVKMEKTVVSSLLMIVIAIAAFNIISSLVLMVADKRFDIAVLRTLGLTRPQIMAVFVVQGGATGAAGVVVGGLVGALLAVNVGGVIGFFEQLLGFQIFDPQVFYISSMPSQLEWGDVALVISVGLILSLLSTLYPAFRATRIEPAEALRYG